MKLTRFKLAFLSYALFDLLIGGHCGGLLPLGSMAAAQQGQAVGNITSAATTCSTTAVPTNCVILQLDAASGAASIDISGTWAATLQIEAFGGVTWAAINCTPPNSTTAVSSTTANGVWQCNVAGFSSIRVRASAYTSGTAAVVINSAHASAKSGGGAVYASGLGTNNVIPKGNGANQLSDSSITDNGTTVSTTESLVLPDGSKTTPSLRWSVATDGFFRQGTFAYSLALNSREWYRFDNAAFRIGDNATLNFSSADVDGVAADAFFGRRGAANFRFGVADVNGTPVDQTLSVQNAITGTDLPGGHTVIDAPLGTGLGAAAKTCINRTLMGSASGATAQTSVNGLCIGETKKLSNTSATAQSLVNISVPSNSAGGAQGSINVSCNDGTNFDSETNTFFVSYVNKATALTIGTVQLGTASAANNSGSCTTAITVTAGTNSVDIKVTPVITTIVPTTVTGTVLSLSTYGTGNPTYQ